MKRSGPSTEPCVVDGDELMSVGEIGSEPGEGSASDAEGGLEMGDENVLMSG